MVLSKKYSQKKEEPPPPKEEKKVPPKRIQKEEVLRPLRDQGQLLTQPKKAYIQENEPQQKL